MTLAFAAVLMLAGALEAVAAPPHADEIAAYVHVLAVAQVVSDQCADILVSQPMLDELRAHLHIADADQANVQTQGSAVAQELVDRIAAAPSLHAWCDAAYNAYGPDGSVVPKLMLRSEAPP